MRPLAWSLSVLSVLASTAGPARAGALAPDLEEVELGDLRMEGIKKQVWDISPGQVTVTLELDKPGPLEGTVLLYAAPRTQLKDWKELARMNKQVLRKLEVLVGGKAVAADVKVAEVEDGGWTRVEATFRTAAPAERAQLRWEAPMAGADGDPKTPELVARYCIDDGTRRALRKAEGYYAAQLVLSKAAHEGKQGDVTLHAIKLQQHAGLPLSLCGKGVRKLDKRTFELGIPARAAFLRATRADLHALGILFAASI